MIVFLYLLMTMLSSGVDAVRLVVVNNCREQIWPAILGNSGHQTLNDGGFPLPAGQQIIIDAPKWWSGRMWARQGCCFDERGNGPCETGDCNRQLRCMGNSGQPPATVVEMTLGTPANPRHYYDVSLVDGFNLPVSMIAMGAGGCGVAACEADVNACCPEGLAVRREGRVVGCKSACLAVGADEYCCRGRYGSSNACKPTPYSKLFKGICPRAYTYAYDEATGLNTCLANSYLITFCPPN